MKTNEKSEFNEDFMTFNNKNQNVTFLKSFVDFAFGVELIDERQCKVLKMMIDGDSLEEVANYYNLTRERIRQIFEKACRKIRRVECIKGKLDSIHALKLELLDTKRLLNAAVEKLSLHEQVEHSLSEEHEREELIKEFERSDELVNILNTSIIDLVSNRALNCLKFVGVETLGDLVQLKETEMLRYRNFGKKSLNELKELLGKYGLSFGMNIKEIYNDRLIKFIKLRKSI